MAPRTSEQFEEIRSERKTQILDAALHVFAEEGYHASSVSRVAKKAGVSKGLLYNYFSGKEEVLHTIVEDLFSQAMAFLDMEEGEEITDERFKEIVTRSVDIPLEQPQRWKLYMSLTFQNDVTEILMEHMEPKMASYMTSMMSYFQSKDHEDPISMMRYFSAVLDGVQMHCLLDPVNFPAEKAKQYIITQFVR